MDSGNAIEQGNAFLKRGQWREAREAFEQALGTNESPKALEGLGTACSWLNDGDGVVRAREEAFRLYVKAGDNRSAARVAAWLANEYGEFRAEGAIAGGWLTRAQRLVENLEPCEEQVTVLTMFSAVTLFIGKNPADAMKYATEARAIAEQVKSADGLMMANALEGLARVSAGEVEEGMRLLDEATASAVGGECENLNFVGTTCCCLIAACERVRDYDRAAQWCDTVKDFCRRWRIATLFSVCRTQYSAVLISRGEYAEAEEELTSATEELSERRPGLLTNVTVRLAELRRRQGRFEEAKQLFRSAETSLLAHLGLGAIALDEQEPATAADYAQRYLRRITEADKVERVPGLDLLLQAYAAAGDIEKAKEVLGEIQPIVNTVRTDPLRATGSYAEGVVAAAEEKHDNARACFEDAVDLFAKAGMPFESVTARIRLVQVLFRLGRNSRARAEAETARSQAEEIGAVFLMDRAGEFFPALSGRHETASTRKQDYKGLSSREREILLLVAEGKDNNRIADELFLSVRTVERHLSNTYRKLGISGKSARSAATAYALRNLESS